MQLRYTPVCIPPHPKYILPCPCNYQLCWYAPCQGLRAEESPRPACLTWLITGGHYRAGEERGGSLFCLFICRQWKPNRERTLVKCSQVMIKYCFKKPQGHLCWHLDKDFIEVTGLGDGLVVPMITGEGGINVVVKNAALLWLFHVHKCSFVRLSGKRGWLGFFFSLT